MSEENNEIREEELEEVEIEESAPEEKKVSKNTSASKPGKKKVKRKNRVAKYFREMRSELKKVVWPTPKQIVNNTVVALVIMAASAVVIWGIDYVGAQIFQAIRALGGK